MERIALTLEPAGCPVAHIDVEVVEAKVAGAVQHFFEMPVARVKMMRLGREAFGEIFRQLGFEKPFHLLHHTFGHPFRREQRVAFQLRGQFVCSGGLQ